MEQFQYSLFIAGKSQMDHIQPGNVGGNGYDIAILYPPESFIGQFAFWGYNWNSCPESDIFYFFNLADDFREKTPGVCMPLECADMKLRDSLTVSGLLAAVMSFMKPCLTPLFTQSAM